MNKSFLIMGILSTIFNLFSCSDKPKSEGGKYSNDLEEQINESFEAFKNRPVYKELTEQIIDTTSDDNLLQRVFDNLSEKTALNYEKEYETVMMWNKSRQAIYMIWILEAEVNNGGYDQFYTNSSGQFHKHLPDALNLVGASKFADLTNRANQTFERENKKITKYQDESIEGYNKSYVDNPLNKFDEEFFELYESEKIHQLQVNFIRRHKSDFIGRY